MVKKCWCWWWSCWDGHGGDAGMVMVVMLVVTMAEPLEIVLLCSVNLNKGLDLHKCCDGFEK